MADGTQGSAFGAATQLHERAIVVLFAGWGGSSMAIEHALGRHPDAALNHWELALGVHKANWPDAEYHIAGALETNPNTVCVGRPVGLLWLSPDCRHFSPAKGAAIVSKRIRALAWAAIPWMKLRRPDVVILENVEAFLTWGPTVIGADGKERPDPARKGETFERWKRRILQMGYSFDLRVEAVADHGGRTIRKRLKIVCRADGQPARWPEPTHAERRVASRKGLRPHRPAYEIIDFKRPCPSIFMTQDEARAQGLKIKRPLEEPTLRRIAKGLWKFTLNNADPFIVPVTHSGDDRAHSVREGLRTVTGANRGEFALVAPIVAGTAHGDGRPRAGLRAWDARDALRGQTGSPDKAVVSASVMRTDMYQSNAGCVYDPRDGLRTVMSGGSMGLLAAHLEEMNGRSGGVSLDGSAPGLSGQPHHGLVAAFMEQANTGMTGHDLRGGVSTIVQKGCTQRLISAQLTHLRGSNEGGGGNLRDCSRSMTAGGQHQALLAATLDRDLPMAVPFSPYEDELRAFLVKYYGSATANDLEAPLDTATSRARFGLVLVAGVAYRITDIGMRMLDPETELAAAMGVPMDGPRKYVLGWTADGRRVSKTNITKMVGNMVAREWAEKIVALNCQHLAAPGFTYGEAA